MPTAVFIILDRSACKCSGILLIKTVEFLGDLIAQDQKLSSALSRQIAALSQEAPAQTQPQGEILLLQCVPQFFFLFQILRCSRLNGKHRAYGHHNFQILDHIMAQFLIWDLSGIIVPKHQPGHSQLLVDPADHHRLIDRLIIPAYEISVEIHIQIIQILYIRKRFKSK